MLGGACNGDEAPAYKIKNHKKKKQIQGPLRVKFTKVDAMERFKPKFQGDTTTKTPKTNSDFRGAPQR